MPPWTGVALALTEPGSDGMHSRLSTYLHPLAGRALAWHTLDSLAKLNPAPERIVLVAGPELPRDLFDDISAPVEVVGSGADGLAAAFSGSGTGRRVLAVDAAVPTAGVPLQLLVDSADDAVLRDRSGGTLAGWVGAAGSEVLRERGGDLRGIGEAMAGARNEVHPDGFLVRCRADLARAQSTIRDRLVRRLMDEGATFVLPGTTLVDVDVRIGRDSMVFPGCVLEGRTTVGEETVIGPHCRIISSWIGSGVELKGFNYVSNTSIRNRAILEAYVRRGFD